jgi:hypothetical protein
MKNRLMQKKDEEDGRKGPMRKGENGKETR